MKPSNESLKEDSMTIAELTEIEAAEEIRSWLDEHPEINAYRNDDHLLLFFRGCKRNMEKTKDKIRRFYTMKSERTEWFSNRNPFLPEIQELLDIGVFLPLEEWDDEHSYVIAIRTAAHNPAKHSQNDVFKVGMMILDIALRTHPEISNHGIIPIFDMTGVSLAHGLQMTPTIIKNAVQSWQLYPSKPKLFEFVNAPTYIHVILNTFRLFMKPKMRSRIVVRKNSEVKVKLPKELGGEGKSYSELAKYWKEIVEKNVEFFKKDEKYKCLLDNSKC